jgi:hypothetical protein
MKRRNEREKSQNNEEEKRMVSGEEARRIRKGRKRWVKRRIMRRKWGGYEREKGRRKIKKKVGKEYDKKE